MEPNSNEQQFVPPTPAPYTPKTGFNWKQLVYFVTVGVVAAAVAGVLVWGYMSNQNDSNTKSLKSQIVTKDNSITSLQKTVSDLNAKTTASASTTTPIASTNSSNGKYEQLLTTCGGTNYEVTDATIAMDNNGVTGSCDRVVVGGVGDLWVYVYTNSSWQKIFETNGADMTTAMCTQYKVPKILGIGCSGNY